MVTGSGSRLTHRWPVAAALALSACSGIQSVHDPAGPHAVAVGWIGWAMYLGAAAIFASVMIALVYAWFARPRSPRPGRPGGLGLVIAGGIVLPLVTLSVLLVFAFRLSRDLNPEVGPDALRIEVIGHMWWWEVRYLDDQGGPPVVSANEIRIPAGRDVEFILTASEVIHSFWIPNLAGKMDMIPGRINRLRLRADRPGTWRGQCAEFCGLQHAWMAFMVVALEPAAFDDWFARERRPAAPPADPVLARGRDTFVSAGCGSCHAIRGVPRATGRIGPDLTHVGSRLSLGAGVLPNGIGPLAAWIVESQQIKPGNRMPSFNQFDGETLRALAGYLESLR